MRTHWFAFLWMLLLTTACGGGGSSPTDPSPPPGNVTLEGSWTGTVVITSPGSVAMTCTLSLSLQTDVQGFFGEWNARCPNGSQGSQITFVQPVLSNLVLVAGLGSPAVFGGCGWSTLARQNGRRLQGDWANADNCQTGPVMSGRLDLTKQN